MKVRWAIEIDQREDGTYQVWVVKYHIEGEKRYVKRVLAQGDNITTEKDAAMVAKQVTNDAYASMKLDDLFKPITKTWG